jgi:hypothetical protein
MVDFPMAIPMTTLCVSTRLTVAFSDVFVRCTFDVGGSRYIGLKTRVDGGDEGNCVCYRRRKAVVDPKMMDDIPGEPGAACQQPIHGLLDGTGQRTLASSILNLEGSRSCPTCVQLLHSIGLQVVIRPAILTPRIASPEDVTFA